MCAPPPTSLHYYLKYLQDWELRMCKQKRKFFQGRSAKMQLSRETIEGLRITGEKGFMYACMWAQLPAVQCRLQNFVLTSLCCLIQFTLLWRYGTVSVIPTWCAVHPIWKTMSRSHWSLLWKTKGCWEPEWQSNRSTILLQHCITEATGLGSHEPIRGNCGKKEHCTGGASSLGAPLPKRPRCAKH